MPTHSPQIPPDCLFVLASGSPRRREFMELLGLPFVVVTPAAVGNMSVDESPLSGETPPDLVERLSRLKAEAVATSFPSLPLPSHIFHAKNCQAVVLAADTVVVLADRILGKPNSPAEAIQMLKQLRKQHHFVYTGLTVAAVTGELDQAQVHVSKLVTRLHQSKVWMRPYTDAEIETYVAGGDPLDKAGAYGIQNRSFAPVAQLEGCFASVMGLPLGELAIALKEMDIPLPAISPRCSRHTGHPCCQE